MFFRYSFAKETRQKMNNDWKTILDIGKKTIDALLMRPLAMIAIAGISGGYCAHTFSYIVSCVFFTVLAIFLCILISHCKSKQRVTLFLSLISFSLMWIFFVSEDMQTRIRSVQTYYDGSAIVLSHPDYTAGYHSITLLLDTNEKVNLLSKVEYPWNSELAIEGELCEISPNTNPGEFNYQSYYETKGIYRTIEVMNVGVVTFPRDDFLQRGYAWGTSVRKKAVEIWEHYVSTDAVPILSAVIVGDDSLLDSNEKASFQSANLSHILVVSGAHVGYLCIPIMFVLGIFGDRRILKTIGLMSVLVMYGFITGWGCSATRSIVMMISYEILRLRDKTFDRYSVFGLAAILLMLNDPYVIFNTGAKLSFGASLSIISFANVTERKIRKAVKFLPDFVYTGVSALISAQIGILPVLFTMGSKQSIFLMIMVLAAGFIAEALCMYGLCVTFLSFFVSIRPLLVFLYSPLQGLVDLLLLCARWGEKISLYSFRLQGINMCLLFGIMTVFIVGTLKAGMRRKLFAILAGVLILAGSLEQYKIWKDEPDARIIVMDVGQGDGTLILCDGKSILIDGGNDGKGNSIVSKVMDYYGVANIDMTILTHLHCDHGRGLLELARKGRIGDIYTPFSGGELLISLIHGYVSENVCFRDLLAPSIIKVSSNCEIRVISPSNPTSGANEDSAVLWVRIYGKNLLFTGDIGEDTERQILDDLPSRIDVLKVAHHGSKYSTSELFLDTEMIDTAVVSTGPNIYGHPSPDTMNRLSNHVDSIYVTRYNGALIVEIDDYVMKVTPYLPRSGINGEE